MSRVAPSAGSGDRLTGIEAIRFVSAVAVLFWHYQHFTFIADEPVGFDRARQPFYAVFAPLYDFGNHGVEIFWCLSGFIFFWKYRESIEARLVSGHTFLVLRVSRLYPLHLVTLLLVTLLQPAYRAVTGHFYVYQENDPTHFIAQLFLATDWGFLSGYSFNGPIWSVSIEVFIYGFFFALLRTLGGALPITLFLTALFAVGHATHLLPYQLSKGLLFFFLGGSTAHVHTLASRMRPIALGGDLVAAAAVVGGLGGSLLALQGTLPAIHPTVLLLAVCPAVIFLVVRHLPLRGAAGRIAETAGSLTYSSYLVHFPLQLAIATAYRFLGVPIPLYSPFFFLAFFGSTLGLSRLLYSHLEMPAQRMLRTRLLTPRR
jgi:peptidoglycan/LPS O-acetylase OafA/YrhL